MFNLPIKIIAQENNFDINYPTIIMLSGQGSSGKSTFQQTYLQNIKTISIDDITREENNWEQCLKKFYIQIKVNKKFQKMKILEIKTSKYFFTFIQKKKKIN